jgi:hypothetical protein
MGRCRQQLGKVSVSRTTLRGAHKQNSGWRERRGGEEPSARLPSGFIDNDPVSVDDGDVWLLGEKTARKLQCSSH